MMSNNRPVAVLGGGNGGCAMAADLSARGHAVHLYEHPDFARGIAAILERRAIRMTGALGDRDVPIHLVTTDLEAAITGVDLIHVVVPSTAQELFLTALARVVRPSHTVVVWAGRFGALEFLRLMRKQSPQGKLPLIVEVDTLPYGARKPAPDTVRILYTSTRLIAGAIPASRSAEAADLLRRFHPEMGAVANVLAAAFCNPALVVYGIGALLNAARIEHMKGEFFLFSEGITPAVAAVMRAAYEEMMQVAKAYDCEIPTFPAEAFDGPLSLEGACFESPQGAAGFAAMDGPRDVRGRYMMENIGDALAPIAELGAKAGVKTPLLDALVTLGSTVCGVDFRTQGRNLARLGMGSASVREIVELISR
jgi:opine dehydrogenase